MTNMDDFLLTVVAWLVILSPVILSLGGVVLAGWLFYKFMCWLLLGAKQRHHKFIHSATHGHVCKHCGIYHQHRNDHTCYNFQQYAKRSIKEQP